MIRIISTVICLVLTIPALSQKELKRTLVLNNGSRISGIIVNDSSDNYIVKVIAPQVITVPKGNVYSVEKMNNKQDHLLQSGYYIRFTTSILAGQGEQGHTNNLSLNISNGYKFNNGLMLGIGTGIEDLDKSLLPLYAEFNYHPLNSHVSPFIFIRSGYAFTLTEDEENIDYYGYSKEAEGGVLFNAGAGILLNTWEKVGINIAFGYRFQRVSITEERNWSRSSNSTEYVTRFNRLELQLGFIFR